MASSLIFPLDLDRHPINSEKIAKMKPKLKIDADSNSFKLTVNLPGYKKEDVSVFAGTGKVAVQAVDRTRFKNLNVCKVYKANYTLPKGAVAEKLRKSYNDGILCISGEIQKWSTFYLVKIVYGNRNKFKINQ